MEVRDEGGDITTFFDVVDDGMGHAKEMANDFGRKCLLYGIAVCTTAIIGLYLFAPRVEAPAKPVIPKSAIELQELYDINNDGKLDGKELGNLFRDYHLTPR